MIAEYWARAKPRCTCNKDEIGVFFGGKTRRGFIATGHYARIRSDHHYQLLLPICGVDKNKDIVFPLDSDRSILCPRFFLLVI